MEYLTPFNDFWLCCSQQWDDKATFYLNLQDESHIPPYFSMDFEDSTGICDAAQTWIIQYMIYHSNPFPYLCSRDNNILEITLNR